MTDFLLYDDAIRSHELRHEITEPVGDPVMFLETGGKRYVAGSVLEEPIFSTREDVVDEFLNWESFGSRDLVKDAAVPTEEISLELVRRVLDKLGVTSAVVPPTFRIDVADYLRSRGIEIVMDADAWTERRRRKNPTELEGIERAQRATENAMLTAARMLREAEPTSGGELRFSGEILTAELIREAMQSQLLSQGAESEEIIIASGDACLDGHAIGHGPILPNQSVIIDCFPRDRRTGAYTDMTRTFVPGQPSPELIELHRHCRNALEVAFESLRAGVDDAHRKVTEYFHSNGFPTSEHHDGDEPLVTGFWHSLGHGVGLQVHERPWLGRRPDVLQEGDVVAIEPGLYFPGVGGVRLEDTVLVTADGFERFTDPFPYDLSP